MNLGKPSPQIDARSVLRQPVVDGGVEDLHPAARGLEQFHGLRVTEGEGPAARDRNHGPASAWGCDLSGRVPRGDVQFRGGPRRRNQGVQVDVRADLGGQPFHGRVRIGPFLHGNQTEMPRGRFDGGITWQHPQDRQPHSLQGGQHLLAMPRGGHLVDDHPREVQGGVVLGQAQRDRRHGTRGVGSIQAQHYRSVNECGDVRRRPEPVGTELPVEQAHHTLDHGDLGSPGTVGQQGRHPALPHQERIQVAPHPSRGERVVTRVDEIGTHLETLDRHPAGGQRRDDPGSDGGFALPRGGCGNDETGNVHHSMPF